MFPDGTRCGEYGWHASDCPSGIAPEVCVHCKARVVFGWPVTGEWAHLHGDRWCHDYGGFTATPLQVATPTFHGPGDVL